MLLLIQGLFHSFSRPGLSSAARELTGYLKAFVGLSNTYFPATHPLHSYLFISQRGVV